MISMDTINRELLELINAYLLQKAEETGGTSETGPLASLEEDLELSNYINSLDFIVLIVNIEKKFNVMLKEDLYILTNNSFKQIAEFIAQNAYNTQD
ncbi:hypothetical protein R70723_28590 [Paenibacillus sp. FSL R7-0273]|uniref:phosphopantetheine-binding protein n=1 Tax=Paenibacillus sp. FSL R7-0273 TaxID=1536772 RepID=UPI0004F91AB1|nr:phosphopantetheine-binding protein [Paenibacillus sp. FSL R7-0273]AIQ49400.1 hypothetical protein R70723_28590 [Paenibacillus sp. FSL R7-0273]OMF85289.1 hypothetical protein BK144_28105 [Paenibacillus sp. FSL R7-0273]